MDTMQTIGLVAESLVREDRWGIEHWDWKPGVAMYGLVRAWQTTENPAYRDFIDAWIGRNIGQADRMRTVNSTAPFLAVLVRCLETGKREQLAACIEAADWMLREAPVTRAGGFEHTVTEDVEGFHEQMWADTLFMAALFLARLGLATGTERYTKAAVNQFVVHHKALRDPATGLFHHGWNCERGDWMSGALWGRANAWITAATVELLETVTGQTPERELLLDSLRQQAAALAGCQRENGMFGTLLDHPDAYDEASATAGIAYGLRRGIKNGFLDASLLPVAVRAERAVCSVIDKSGAVGQVSGGTPVMQSLDAYKTIRVGSALYGQGLALLMLSEMEAS